MSFFFKFFLLIFFVVALSLLIFINGKIQGTKDVAFEPSSNTTNDNPLSIDALRARKYDADRIKIERELDPEIDYKRYIAFYSSDGFKIYGLLTVPNEASKEKKAPAIVFGHGYIPPEEYQTTERYEAYVNSLAKEGYVVFKIDFRGHGDSEGHPEGAYFSPTYTIDAINAAEGLKKLPYVNPGKIGAWGHSMSGMVITRALVALPQEFQAAVIWGGVVGSHEDIMQEWWSRRRRPTFTPSNRELNANRPSRQAFVEKYGEPNDANAFWKSISPKTYLSDLETPIQLHHGGLDETVPPALSQKFSKAISENNKIAELYIYPEADHNISSPSFEVAMRRTIEFFNKYLK